MCGWYRSLEDAGIGQQRFYVYFYILQATVSRILSAFVDAMVKKASHYIYMHKKEEILRVAYSKILSKCLICLE